MAAASVYPSVRARSTFVLSVTLVLLQLCAVWTAAQPELCYYAATCKNMSLSTEISGRPVLTASCIDCNRVVLTTAAIDLNQRVQFKDGRLQCAATGGSFTKSCSNLALRGSTLSATCRESGGGSSIAASIDLTYCIGNINGNLKWCVGHRICGGMYSPAMATQDEYCYYAGSCKNVSLNTEISWRPVLTASCKDCKGVVLTTAAIDLNQRVQFKNGRLQCGATGGSFTNSCSDLALSGSTLSATCLQSGGGSVAASIDLDNCIGNINGNLDWCVGTPPCKGMYSPAMALALTA